MVDLQDDLEFSDVNPVDATVRHERGRVPSTRNPKPRFRTRVLWLHFIATGQPYFDMAVELAEQKQRRDDDGRNKEGPGCGADHREG
jgi:hypothetical protein